MQPGTESQTHAFNPPGLNSLSSLEKKKTNSYSYDVNPTSSQASSTPINVLQMHNIKLGKEIDEKVGRYLQSWEIQRMTSKTHVF
jgi:hypothetical protein